MYIQVSFPRRSIIHRERLCSIYVYQPISSEFANWSSCLGSRCQSCRPFFFFLLGFFGCQCAGADVSIVFELPAAATTHTYCLSSHCTTAYQCTFIHTCTYICIHVHLQLCDPICYREYGHAKFYLQYWH